MIPSGLYDAYIDFNCSADKKQLFILNAPWCVSLRHYIRSSSVKIVVSPPWLLENWYYEWIVIRFDLGLGEG